jgi:hypothetical protein
MAGDQVDTGLDQRLDNLSGKNPDSVWIFFVHISSSLVPLWPQTYLAFASMIGFKKRITHY